MTPLALAREQMVTLGKSMFDRGLTPGASANISIKVEEGFLMTPTGSCIGFLNAETLSLLDENGNLISGDKPSKEFILHKAIYDQRPDAGAVIHLHSTWSTALSCKADLNPDDVIPPLTPYLIMRLGRIGLVPYFPPGAAELGAAVREKAADHAGILMANHGPIVAGKDLITAMFNMEELEESAKLMLLLEGKNVNPLAESDRQELLARFG
ncbi:3-oxo-tetronate 4-phosphate decarboxylase [Catenovulum agarivorans]|uniref:3-oxo-tetronate 4-phosphate decarboxylase n=1 Tax=Catenovulum agarivorans TaxID=1172192 RepID=UPI0002E68DD4|nr:3-oxo-tetronate 4-phosphate decarboxylase [Catenovulum agarivorans]